MWEVIFVQQKRKFYLPFLAHGFVRFLLVAVGEAGRPNVEDD